jgi:hypothetical protein
MVAPDLPAAASEEEAIAKAAYVSIKATTSPRSVRFWSRGGVCVGVQEAVEVPVMGRPRVVSMPAPTLEMMWCAVMARRGR